MNCLALMLFSMGITVVAVLTMDIWSTSQPILWATVAGFAASIPISRSIGRQNIAVTGRCKDWQSN